MSVIRDPRYPTVLSPLMRAQEGSLVGGLPGVTPSPADWIEALLRALKAGRRPGTSAGRPWQCPAHEDSSPSLVVRSHETGRAAVRCCAGCDTKTVLGALGLGLRHLYEPPPVEPHVWVVVSGIRLTFPPVEVDRGGSGPGIGYRFESEHAYGDRWRLVRYRHPTTRAKRLHWETRDTRGAWIPGLRNVPADGLPLYREHEARQAVGAGELVFVVESESSVDALARTGRYATTWAGGASAPRLDRLVAVLTGGRVLLVPDNDPPGLVCARRLSEALGPVVESLGTVLPDEGQDARDLLDADPSRLPAW